MLYNKNIIIWFLALSVCVWHVSALEILDVLPDSTTIIWSSVDEYVDGSLVSLMLLDQQISLFLSISHTDNDMSVLSLSKDAYALARFDVVDALSLASDRKMLMDDYLQKLSTILNRLPVYIEDLSMQISDSDAEQSSCADAKRLSDASYLRAIQSFDQESADRALQESQSYESCVVRYRIDGNALRVQETRLRRVFGILQQRYDYLSTHQYNIVTYFPILQTDIIQDLSSISQVLESYDFDE